ncbi:hypothetical protein GpartN1_g3270.t1 [Galdieria partita]|uniref:Actin n=1 Tax=Galdieria partita TaxID=83374 RepID=A0A9C7PWF5_9RHOD|nr:hypothetical protein GpartN1_g3270.t1 [Galdieria partita]
MEKPIVIDNGTGFIKAGFAGDKLPRVVSPSVVGRPTYGDCVDFRGTFKSVYVGDDAVQKRGAGLKLTYPLEHGIVSNWDDLELLWKNCLENELRVDPAEHPVLLTEAPLNPKRNRELMATIMFEGFGVPACYVAVQAVLSLYATGRTTGLVLDIGDGVSHTIPVYEGYALSHAISRLNVAGRDLTKYLAKLLQQNGYPFTTTSAMQTVREIKENFCYVSQDPVSEERYFEQHQETLRKNYILPDGTELFIGSEMFQCPEILFNPSLLGMEAEGIDSLVYFSTQKCDIDLRRSLLTNLVISGGTSMLPGLVERLRTSLQSRLPASSKIKITAPEERKYSVFCGGATLADLEAFQSQWITKDEWEEFGNNIIFRKCL